MSNFCEFRNCNNLASSTFLGFCNEEHMEKGKSENPNWFDKLVSLGLFEIFWLRDTKPRKKIAKYQVRPLFLP